MENYRELLQKLENEAQDQYDKTVLYLSTGALGISFAFLKDIVSIEQAISTSWLICAWVFWAVSVTAVLYSFYSSRLAIRKAIEAVDIGEEPKNKADKVTSILNILSGVLFFLGMISIIFFVYKNFEVKQMSSTQNKQNSTLSKNGKNIPAMPSEMKRGQNIPKAPEQQKPQPPPPQQEKKQS